MSLPRIALLPLALLIVRPALLSAAPTPAMVPARSGDATSMAGPSAAPSKAHPVIAPRQVGREAASATAWPTQIGPFKLVSKDGRNSLALGFAGQLELRLEDKDQGSGSPRDEDLKPLLRRVRLTLGGSFASKNIGYYLQLSTAPNSLELMDFWLEWSFSRFATVRVGLQKINFTRHRTGSFKDLTFVDWSLVSPTFGDERQIGLAFHNYQGAPNWLVWAFGVFTGINQRASHALGIARTFREDVPNPSDLTDPAPVDRFHPELTSRIGYRRGDMTLDTDTDWEGGPLRLYAGLGATWDLDADPVRDHAARLAAEALVKVRHLSVAASFYSSWARELGGGRLDQRFAMWGLLGQWSVLVARRYEISARYALIQRAKAFLHTARDRADALIAAATDPDEQAALTSQYRLAGLVHREHEATLGFNVYLVGRSLKLQLDVSWLGTERLTDSRDDIRSRLQLQLAF